MRLCVTSTGKEIEANIDASFGRASWFLIIDTDTNAIEAVENTAAALGQGTGVGAAQLVLDEGVDGVLTGRLGPNALRVLQASGIKLFLGVSSQDTIKAALVKFSNGEYCENPASPDGLLRGQGRRRGLGRGMGGGGWGSRYGQTP
jgi:predicted Fe-Mo cluster-binding NifX family protein